MKKFLQKRLGNEKGLTLVELLAVIVILGIIAAIAIPSIGNVVTNSRVNALKADGQNVLAAANLYFVEKGSAEGAGVDTNQLKTDGYIDDIGGFGAPGGAVPTITKSKTGNSINGTAANGNIKVVFENATNANINAADTKEGPNLRITR